MANWNELKEYLDEDKFLYIAIKRAFNDLYRFDKYLIDNGPSEKRCPEEIGKHYIGERSIVFRFAHYLQNELAKSPKYSQYNLDCEYNRNGIATKSLPDFSKGTFPDLIIHKRGKNGSKNNLLIMEFKTYWNSNTGRDIDKVKQFVDEEGKYKYKYGIVVVIGKKLSETKLKCI